MVDVNVLVGNNTLIDEDVYQLWLRGHLAEETAAILQRQGILTTFNVTFDVLQLDVQNQFRMFSLMEKTLKFPQRLSEQLVFQVTPETRAMLIENYYRYDSAVIRELLGKKLTSRDRKDLDIVMEKTKVPLRSCRRQFDNMKRVFKTVEEMEGSLVENIKTNFLLSPALARQYAAMVFITNQRFETNKRKLQYLSFEDLAHCAYAMIVNWSYSSKECQQHEDMDVDLDREFLKDLRDLRPLCDKDYSDDHKTIVLVSLQASDMSDHAYVDVDKRFSNLSKILVNIAAGLNHSKEVRDLFIDLLEKFIEPLKANEWSEADVSLFLKAFTEKAEALDFLRQDVHLLSVWERYMKTLTSIILRMYPNY